MPGTLFYALNFLNLSVVLLPEVFHTLISFTQKTPAGIKGCSSGKKPFVFINRTLFEKVVKTFQRKFFFSKHFVKISTLSNKKKKSNFNRVFTAFEDFLPEESMAFLHDLGSFLPMLLSDTAQINISRVHPEADRRHCWQQQ